MFVGYVAFYYQFWMYVYKYEFEENKGNIMFYYNIFYIAVLVMNKHYLCYFRYSTSTQSYFVRLLIGYNESMFTQ